MSMNRLELIIYTVAIFIAGFCSFILFLIIQGSISEFLSKTP